MGKFNKSKWRRIVWLRSLNVRLPNDLRKCCSDAEINSRLMTVIGVELLPRSCPGNRIPRNLIPSRYFDFLRIRETVRIIETYLFFFFCEIILELGGKTRTENPLETRDAKIRWRLSNDQKTFYDVLIRLSNQ